MVHGLVWTAFFIFTVGVCLVVLVDGLVWFGLVAFIFVLRRALGRSVWFAVYGLVWTPPSLVWFEEDRRKPNPRPHLTDQSGAIWSYLELSGAIWSYLELSGTIWNYLELSGAI